MTAPQENAYRSWTKFLNPESLRSNLIVASMLIAAFETLRNSVIEPLKGFYAIGFDAPSPEYAAKVLSRHKSPLKASLLWFREANAIDDSDIATVDSIREHRNEVAHQLPKFLSTADANVNLEMLVAICQIVCKIDRWWIRDVEMSTDPDMTPERLASVDDSDISSGNMMFLRMMIDIASGDAEKAAVLYNTFVEAAQSMGYNQNTTA